MCWCVRVSMNRDTGGYLKYEPGVCLSVRVRPWQEQVVGGTSGVPPASRVSGASRSKTHFVCVSKGDTMCGGGCGPRGEPASSGCVGGRVMWSLPATT